MNLDQDRVPATYLEAVTLLSFALNEREKTAWTSMTAARMFDLQAELARTLRADWSLDDPSTPLRLFFRKLGLDDPKEISMLLIDGYWRAHNNEPASAEDLVKEYLEDL